MQCTQDYEDFDMANEVDELEMFLHLPIPSKLIENDTTADKVGEPTLVYSDPSLKKMCFFFFVG